MTTRSTASRLAATLGLALLIGTLGLLTPVFVSLLSLDAGWTVTTWTAYVAIAVASFVGGWKFRLPPYLGLVVGYLFGWFNLILINGQLFLNVLRQSPAALLVLFLLSPLSYGLVGLTAAVLGWLVRRYSVRRGLR